MTMWTTPWAGIAMQTNLETTLMALAALAGGVLSGVLYARKRQWINAVLVAVAALALAVALAGLQLPAGGANTLTMVTDAGGNASEAALLAVPEAGAIALSGDGLRDAEWRDLPARPLQWTPADADMLWLDFPRTLPLGRMFTLSVRRALPQAGWRLQLLAENKQVLADSNAAAPGSAANASTATAAAPSTSASANSASASSQLSVQWLPPVAESMVLQARLLDAAGKVIAQGPIPLQVQDALPLQIQGRFDAPSFDARALNQLLADGGAILDWQVTLGKAIARSETARAELTAPNALFVDAAYVERLSPAARAALLAQSGQGLPLVVLGGNAADAALWQRDLGLRLHPQSATTEKEDTRQFSINGAALSLPPAALNPADEGGDGWTVAARDGKKRPWLWQRRHGQGRVVWVGVADWHRYAISAPQALGLWWQTAMDGIALATPQKSAWRLPDAMPVPGLRSEVCAQGVKAGTALSVAGMAPLQLQARADKAEAVCAAIWPQKAGWLKFAAAGTGAGADDAMPAPGLEYIYAKSDWPLWQKALRREATARYAARLADSDAAKAGSSRPLPTMPFTIVFALCMLVLWWREQKA